MTKVKKPLMSFSASRSIARAVSYVTRHHITIAEKKPEIPDARSLAQLSWRHMYQKAVALWQALSAAEKQEWESLARSKHMTGFAWFISQALKPNPGLYLPLQGGVMAGDIDMAKNRLLRLPLPIDDQDPVTKKYFEDNLPVGGYTEGCKIYHSAHQSIPNNTYTNLSFDSEVYDTDEMHDLVINPERITIKTAGIYLITFHGNFAFHATGCRRVYLRQNASYIQQSRQNADPTQRTTFNLSTIEQLTIGKYFVARVFQNSGAPLNFDRWSSYSPYMMAQRIG